MIPFSPMKLLLLYNLSKYIWLKTLYTKNKHYSLCTYNVWWIDRWLIPPTSKGFLFYGGTDYNWTTKRTCINLEFRMWDITPQPHMDLYMFLCVWLCVCRKCFPYVLSNVQCLNLYEPVPSVINLGTVIHIWNSFIGPSFHIFFLLCGYNYSWNMSQIIFLKH